VQVVYLTRSTEVTYAPLGGFIPHTEETMFYIYTREITLFKNVIVTISINYIKVNIIKTYLLINGTVSSPGSILLCQIKW
jgi:hypothetical protein